MSSQTANHSTSNEDERSGKVKWRTESFRANEISGFVFGGLAAMMLLALVSYAPEQLPSWVPLSETVNPKGSQVDQVEGNWVGPVGSAIAGYGLHALGVAAYLVPLVFVMWAIQIFAAHRFIRIRNYLCLVIFVVSVACIADTQKMFFQDWIERFQLPGSLGGLAGQKVGQATIGKFFGPGGSFIMMTIIAALTLTVITGIHPFRFLKRAGQIIGSIFRRIDWEKKWSLWSGIPVEEEETFTVASRALPTTEVFTVEPVITKSADYVATPVVVEEIEIEQPEVVTVEVEDQPGMTYSAPVNEVEVDASSILADEPENIEVPRPASAKSEEFAPSPERIRRIIDASKRQQDASITLSFDTGKISLNTSGHYPDYQLPTLDLLSYADDFDAEGVDDETLIQMQNHIVRTLECFKVEVEPGDITKGPTVTRYEVYPSPGLRVNKIVALKDDIARATRAERINILAPIPGKDTVGIEIANSTKVTVAIRELFESEAFRASKAKLPLVLGKDVYGQTIIGDLTKMPHLLVAGATGSGKSVCVNSIIASLLYRFTPDELRFIMIDPKVVEMQLYNSLPHMVVPVVTEPKKVIMALRWVIREMEDRYTIFAKKGVRSFENYNKLRAKELRGKEQAEKEMLQPNLFDTETGEDIFSEEEYGEEKLPDSGNDNSEFPERLPYIVVIIDELADLMQSAPADVETSIARIAQKARAAGIHLIIATQTPRADVVTGLIKANIPSRIAFQVSSKTDSRIILDENGAENLVGKGDMLYLPPGSAQVIRAQGALITDEEAQSLVDCCAAQGEPLFQSGDEEIDFGFMEEDDKPQVSQADEEIISKCMEVIFTEKKASTSLLQRKLRLGYTRAARMIDILESRGIIGPGDGAKPREILIDLSAE